MNKNKESASQKQHGREPNNVKSSDLGMYSYQLVLFSNETVDGLLSIECVPHEWLDYDEATKKCVTKYMPPPYTKIKQALLKKMIKQKDDPDEDWPTYEIEIRGQAETYDYALQKLKMLRKEQYAFTTEPETSKAETSQRLHKLVERNRLEKGCGDTLEQAPDINSSSGSETQFSVGRVDLAIEPDEFAEMSSDENRNLTTASNRNTKGVGQLRDTCRSIDRDQHKSTPKKHKVKRTSDRGNVLPRHRIGSTKLVSSKSLNGGAATEPDTDKFGEMSSSNTQRGVYRGDNYSDRTTDRDQYKSTAKNCNDERTSNRDNIPPSIHKQSRQPTSSKSFNGADSAEFIPVPEESTKSKSYSSRDGIEKEKSTKSVTAEPKNIHDLEKLKNNYKSIRYDVNKIKNDVSAIKDLLIQALENVPGLTHLTFHDKYPLDIPFKTKAAFQDFDTRLTDDKELRKEFIQSLQMAINSSESLSKVIVNILKKWVSKDVAMEFTAVKVIGDKMVMKDTQFCKCLLKAFDIKMATDPKLAVFSEKNFYEKLGAVLGNARDWEGRKAERSQKKRNSHLNTKFFCSIHNISEKKYYCITHHYYIYYLYTTCDRIIKKKTF